MPTDTAPVSGNKVSTKAAAGCLRLFFLPFLLAGVAMLYFLGIRPLVGIVRASSWEATPCEILSSGLRPTHDSDGGDTYRIEVKYTFRFQGRRYESDRYSFGAISSSGYTGKKAIVDELEPGSLTTCYVNPSNPAEAVLQRRATWELLWGLFALPFLAVGYFGFIYAPRLNRARVSGRGTGGPLSSTLPSRPKSVSLTEPDSPAAFGPAVLKPETSRSGKLIGMFFFAVIWNGLVSIFVWHIVRDFQRGHPEWFLAIFMVPFVLVGIGTIAGVFYFLVALMNPRLRLEVSSAAVPLGGEIEASWSFSGRAERIRKLEITLIGAERATYRRGTDTRSDENVFAKLVLFDTSDSGSLRTGSTRFTVPGDLMHSFKARNNSVIWKLKVHGDIPRFPDVNEEFPLTVLPKATVGL